MADQTADLRAEVAQLRGQLASLDRQARSQRETVRAAASPDAGVRLSPEEAQARWEQRHREYLAGLESSFRREPSDARWSARTTAAIHEALDASDVGLKARQIECRSRSCRVEIPLDDVTATGKAMPLFANHLARHLPSIVADNVDDPGGGKTMILYLASTMERPSAAP